MQSGAISQLVATTFVELGAGRQSPSPARFFYGIAIWWGISSAAAIYAPCGLQTATFSNSTVQTGRCCARWILLSKCGEPREATHHVHGHAGWQRPRYGAL